MEAWADEGSAIQKVPYRLLSKCLWIPQSLQSQGDNYNKQVVRECETGLE